MRAALPLLDRAVAEDPDSPLTYAALAEARQWKWFLSKDNAWLERAKESLLEAQRRNLDLAQVHRVAGLFSYREGLHELAAEECRRAIALDPSDGEAHRVLGQAHEAADRLNEALAQYRKEITRNPRDARTRSHLAFVCARLGDSARAESDIEQALNISPDDGRVRFMAVATFRRLWTVGKRPLHSLARFHIRGLRRCGPLAGYRGLITKSSLSTVISFTPDQIRRKRMLIEFKIQLDGSGAATVTQAQLLQIQACRSSTNCL